MADDTLAPIPKEGEGGVEEENIITRGVDAYSCEFIYYGSVLKIITQTLSNESDRLKVTPWVKKLFQPEYQTTKLREKRNKYLAKLIINIFNDEVIGVFSQPPPKGALEDPRKLRAEAAPAAEWETDKMWQEILLSIPDGFKLPECTLHGHEDMCRQDKDKETEKLLDMLFQFLLYLVRPYAAMLPPDDRTRISTWLQTLCCIHGNHCTSLKSIRNDYMFCLLGYLHDLRIVGPFLDYPPKKLESLDAAVIKAQKKYHVTDPANPVVNEFLKEQPMPEEGAFCYIALTGDLVATNIG